MIIQYLRKFLLTLKFSENYKILLQNPGRTFIQYWDRFLFAIQQNRNKTQVNSNLSSHHDYYISIIIPVYNGPVKWLKEAIESVLNQSENNWELCIVDDNSTKDDTIQFLKGITDPRIQIKFSPINQGISCALNTGIRMSTGSYLTFLDQDDLLEPDMLKTINEAIQRFHPEVIYSDENLYYQGFPTLFSFSPHFKPDYSPDLLLSHNYITHLMVLKRDILNSCGLFHSEFDGAQDYDLILRVSEYADSICHIRKIQYRWRIHTRSTSNTPDSRGKCTIAGKKVLEEALKRRKISGTVEYNKNCNYYNLKRDIIGSPLISIIISFRDHPEILNRCLESIYRKTTYPAYEILLVDYNNLLKETTVSIKKWLEIFPNLQVIHNPHPFNFSAMSNYAVSESHGEYVVLMNSDIEIISSGWVEALLEHAQREEIGAVGGKLFFPDGRIKHAGIAVGIRGLAGYPHQRFAGNSKGYYNHLDITRNVSTVTNALFMIQKSKYLEIGGFDEVNLNNHLNDIDFCLRLLEKGYMNIFTPHCEAIHAELRLWDCKNNPEKKPGYQKEDEYIRYRHAEILKSGDPWYNPNFSPDSETMRFPWKVSEEKKFGVFRRGKNGRMYYEPIMKIDA